MIQVKDLLANNLTNSDRKFIFNALKPKLDALGYSEVEYLFLNTTTRTVTTYSGARVFCYCKMFSVWYWCIDQTPSCPDTKDAFQNQDCNMRKKTDIPKMNRAANGQVEAKPNLPILVSILVLSILVTI
jgi:hypothetical protein